MRFLSSIPSINEGSFFFFFLAFLLLPPAECQMKFTSIYQGKAVTGLVGSSVNFTWSFSGVNAIDWGIKRANAGTLTVKLVSIDKLGKVTFPSSSGSVDYNGRVNGILTGDTSSGQVIFTLSNIKKTDTNLYSCVLNPPSPVQVALVDEVNLRVEELPRIVYPNVSQTTYNERGRVSIRCEATSTPEPDVRWIHNGQVKNPGLKTTQISFSPISRSDAGIYICRANNSVGTREKRLTVVVNYKPDGINLTTSAAHNTAIQGDDVTLTCTVAAANPQVSEYKFYLNDSKNAINSGTNIRSYTINGVQRARDYGKYKCVAHNTVGDGQSNEVVLDIKVPAKIETLTGNVTVDEGNAINLTCDVSGYPVPTVTWQKDGKPFQFAGSGVIHIGRSTRQDAGTYICNADNRVAPADQKITFVTVNYAATITSISSSVSESWRGQTVRLRCASDGVPTPTLSWYTPGETRFNPVIGKENTVDVTMNSDEDFGFYNCTADNGFAPVSRTVRVQQIKAPGSPSITTTNEDIQATSLTVKWTAPTDDGGSPITAYRVVILQGGAEKENKNITDPNARRLQIGELQKDTNFTVKVFARNFVFEGEAGQRIIKTKFEGIPAAAEIIGLPPETKNTKLSLKWLEPQNNGAAVEQYNVYQRTVRDDGTRGKWNKLNETKKPLVREVVVQLSKGKEYEFVVTAINRFGESFKEEEKIKKTIVLGDAPVAVVFTVKVKDDEVTFKWEEPENNGGVITKYSIYQRTTSDKKWKILKSFTEISKRDYAVKVQKGKAYEFVVTATNKFGESSKTNFKKVDVLEDKSLAVGTRGKLNVAVIAGAAAAGVLLILGVVLFSVWWKRRKTSSDAGSSAADLRGPNPDDFEDGYEAVGAASAARQLQAYGPAADVTYAQPDMSQTKSRRKVTGVYPKMGKVKEATQKPKKPFVIQNPSAKHTMNDTQTYATPISGDYMPLNPRTRSWEVMREQVDIIKVIGKGAFSQVAQATVKNARGYQEYITVAVKMLKANAPASDRKDLLSELDLMKKLKPHPHVIKLIGCVTESDPLLVLIEYVPFGDLLGYLRNSRGLNDKYYKDPDAKPQSNLTAEQLMKFAWQIADGMCYLSSKKIIHRDLAARNVLVGEGEVCKITDFGMARNVHQDDIYSRKSRGRLPVKWTAYEALFYGQYTTQSDVWSYGVLLYEILTIGGSPYPTVKAREIAMKIQEGYRMPKPRHIDEKLYEIMLRCWEENPGDRPTFEKLRKTMKDMERSHRTYVNLTQYDDSLYANINDLAAE